MAVDYQSLESWKLWASNLPGSLVNAEDTSFDPVLEECLAAASRQIDGDTGRVFYRTDDEAREFAVDDTLRARFVDAIAGADIVVKIDTNGDDTAETTLATTDYVMMPRTSPSGQVSVRYNALMAARRGTYRLHPGQIVEITTSWGCVDETDSPPSDIIMACNLRALRLFARRETPLGAVSVPTMGMVGMIRGRDQDYQDLIRPWVIGDEEPQYAIT